MSMVDITAIIPTRDRVEMLKRAVTSASNQAAVKAEIIVVDDGEQCLKGSAVYSWLCDHNVRYFYTGGSCGGGFARNLGVEHAQGDLIAFLDDDDRWYESKLQKQRAAMQDEAVGICYTGVHVQKGDSVRYTLHYPRFEDHYKSIMEKNFIGTTSSVMIRKSILMKIGGFDPALPALQDYDLYIRILQQSRALWIHEPLTIYNDHTIPDKVSGNRSYYVEAVRYMREKYTGASHYDLLKKSLRKIELLKMFRSRQFLFDSLCWYLRRMHG